MALESTQSLILLLLLIQVTPVAALAVQPGTTAGQLLVTWTRHTENSLLDSYSLQYRKTSDSSLNYTTVFIFGLSTTSQVLMDLDLGTGYSVRIALKRFYLNICLKILFACSNVPWPPVPQLQYSSEQSATTYGYSPALSVSASPLAQPGEIRVAWTTPTPPTGSSIISYSIQYRVRGSSGAYTTINGIVSIATSHTISGLTLGAEYELTATGQTEIGDTSSTYGQVFVTVYEDSPAPSTPSVQPKTTAGQLLVTWNKLTVNDGSTITAYSLQYRRTSPSSSSYTTVPINSGDTTSHVLMSLDLGTGYSVRIASVNQLGTGPYSSEQSATTYGYSPALSVSASPLAQRGKIQVSWTTPTPPTGSSITSYSIQYRVTGSSGAYTPIAGIVSTTTSHTISGLTPGAEYEVRATALTEIGATSSTYGLAFVTVYEDSPAPSTPSVLPKTTAGQLLVTWNKLTVNDGSTITAYSLQYRRTSTSSSSYTTVPINSGDTISHMLMSLDLGTAYSVRIASVNQLGTGQYSNEQSATTYGYSPTLSVSASPLSQPGEIQVSWTTPTPPTGSSITSYSIQYRVRGSSGAYTTINGIVSTATSHTISGLTLGAEYEVRATGQTEIGATSSTYGQAFVTTYNVPRQVQSLTITVSKIEGTQGNKRLTITWIPPQPRSDQRITSYDVSYRVLQPTVVWMGEFSPSSTQHMYSKTYEVAEGQDYEVRVRAVSVIGGGEYDTQRTQVPDEPAITSRQYYETSIKLAWTRSRADDFIIYYKKAQTDSTEYIDMDSTEPIATITGLELNTHYKMIIGARNRFGTTNGSTVDTYTLAEAPGSTTTLALSPSSIQVTWTPPMNTESQPGRLAVDYRVTYAGISPYTTENRTADTATANLTITGLHPYIKYTISVQAHNSAGNSAAISTTAWTYSDKPTMQPGERSYHTMSRLCSLTWKSPPSTGRNGIITNYLLQIEYPDGAIRNKTVGLSNPTFTHPEETTYNLTDLTPYTTYKWRVAATTVNGTGPFSASLLTFTTLEDVPGPISNLSFTASSNTTAKVSWGLPRAPNGVVTQYTVEGKEVTMGSNMTVKNITRLAMTTTTLTTLNNLRAYIPYNVTVTAHTSVGAGEPTSIILFTVEGVPQAPIEVTNVEQRGESSILVEWKGLSLREAKGFPYYIITYTSQDGTATATFTTNQSRLVITGLQADTGYLITVEAGTSVGLGPKITRFIKTVRVDSLTSVWTGVSVGILAMAAVLVATVIIVAIWAVKRRKRQADNGEGKNHAAIYDEVNDAIAVGKARDGVKNGQADSKNDENHEVIYDEVCSVQTIGKAGDGIEMKKNESYGEVHFNVYENMITKM